MRGAWPAQPRPGNGVHIGARLRSALHEWIRSWISLGDWVRIVVQITIHCRICIGRDGHLGQSEFFDIS